MLAWGGIAYHFVEFGIALAAGLAASSIALIGFGADSLIEALAGFVVLWLFTGTRVGSHDAERRAQQLIAVSFFVLAAYVGVESIRTLAGGQHPEVSWVGIGLAAVSEQRLALDERDGKQLACRIECVRGLGRNACDGRAARQHERPQGRKCLDERQTHDLERHAVREAQAREMVRHRRRPLPSRPTDGRPKRWCRHSAAILRAA